jgi:hypothetical protein
MKLTAEQMYELADQIKVLHATYDDSPDLRRAFITKLEQFLSETMVGTCHHISCRNAPTGTAFVEITKVDCSLFPICVAKIKSLDDATSFTGEIPLPSIFPELADPCESTL